MNKTNILGKLLLLICLALTPAIMACGSDDEPANTVANNDQKGNGTDNGTDNGKNDGKNDGTESDGLPALPTPPAEGTRFVGGDLSMLLKFVDQKAAYSDREGNRIANVLGFVKEQGWNTVRVRLFVDPSKDTDKAVVQDLDYVKRLGKQVRDAGLYFMLDFHYSDTWADPGKQWTPNAWLSLSDEQLYQKIYEYTTDCLKELRRAGACPDLIQTGNEISYGMLWGKEGTNANRCYTNSVTANWTRFITLLKQAGKACREVCPQSKIIIHSERTPKADVLTDFFDRMKDAGLDYDIIGLSYYPYFHGQLAVLNNAVQALESKNYGKAIHVVETGYPSKWAVPGTEYDYSGTYPYSAEGQRQYVAGLIDLLKQHPTVEGLNWWYAEANAYGCTGDLKNGWYNAGLFDNETGRALPALYEMQNFK